MAPRQFNFMVPMHDFYLPQPSESTTVEDKCKNLSQTDNSTHWDWGHAHGNGNSVNCSRKKQKKMISAW